MAFTRALFILLLLIHSSLRAQEVSLVQKGNDALAARLWELATLHFEQALANEPLDPAAKSAVAIRLCEAKIRDGKPEEALKLLGQDLVAQHPEAPFWKGQALAAMGRFIDAIAILKPLIANPKSPHRHETGLTVSSLELALAEPQTALKTLSLLDEGANPGELSEIRLRQSLILLDLDRIDEARETLPNPKNVREKDQATARFIDAQLLLREEKFDEAITRFQSLINEPRNLPMERYHAAVTGLADALRAKGDHASSAEWLLNFIQDHPDSPQLEEIFKRLLEALPDNPMPDNPILERLAQWITPPMLPSTGLIVTEPCSAVAAWPVDAPGDDLLAFSLFTRAAGLHQMRSDAARDEAYSLLNRLRLENPNHFLANRALLTMARWQMDAGETVQAMTTLQILQESATSPHLKGQAAFLQAESAYQGNDPARAAELFAQAAAHLSGVRADAALFNAALIRLTEFPDSSEPIIRSTDIQNRKLAADLQLERTLAISEPADRLFAIERFLIEHPTHPRRAEARLAAAQSSLETVPPDISFAKAQIATIEADPDGLAGLAPAVVAITKLRIDDLSENPDQTIAAARTLIADFPSSSQANEASFILGRNLYQTGNYNDARIILESLAQSGTNPQRTQAAWLLAARSAALVPTTQSQQESLALFDKAIAIDGPVKSLANLEKARLMIDMNLLEEAASFLRKWFATLPENDPLHLPAGLLLGEAIYAQGSTQADSLNEALAIYDHLAKHTVPFSATYDRIQYMRGLTLEQLPDPENPSLKRDKLAFITYYSVLERSEAPEQWQYFELCGFRALALLEKAKRWPAAIACAKKIASFKGPRADEAAARANQIQLRYMIWED